jgi:hypothetical protein
VVHLGIGSVYNDLHNLRGQPPMLKPDAAIQRQVDAVVIPNFLFLN